MSNVKEALLCGLSAAACALIITYQLKKRRKSKDRWRNRRWWVKPWISRRDEGHSIHELVQNELRNEDAESYKNYLRMDSSMFQKLLELVRNKISKQNTILRESISAEKRLSLTLRYLATGETFSSLRFLYRISTSAISAIVPEVCEAIYEVLKEKYLKCPTTEREWQKISDKFWERWNFPNCLRALDGKHIAFQAPRSDGSLYRNYKNFDSIVLLAVVDADYKFLFIDIGCNGRISDGGVLRNSILSNLITSNSLHFPLPQCLPQTNTKAQFVFVADDAFPLMYNETIQPQTH